MLRNKLSKLIFGIMAAVMVLGAGVSGQASHAKNSGVMAIAQQTGKSEIIDNNNANKIKEYIERTDVTVLEVKSEVTLSKEVVEAINKRTTPLEIRILDGGSLVVNDSVSLDGTSSKLEITRDPGKKGEILHAKNTNNNGTMNVAVKGITFNNNDVDDTVFSNVNSTISLSGNTFIGGGYLFSNGVGNNKLDKNEFYGGATILKGEKFEIKPTILYVNSDSVYFDVVVELKTTAGTGSVQLDSGVLELVDSGSVILKKIESKITRNTIEDNFTGLVAGAKYTIILETIKDQYGNSHSFDEQRIEFTTFKSEISGLNTSGAKLSIQHGSVPAIDYPLTVEVKSGENVVKTYEIKDSKTTSLDLTGLYSNTQYTYEIKDKEGYPLDKKTFRTTAVQNSGSTVSGSGSVITGGSSGSSGSAITGTGNSTTVSGSITSNDMNKSTITDIKASIIVGNSSLSSNLNNGKEFKTNIDGVTVKYSNGQVEFVGLVPEKEYKNLTVTYKDANGNSKTVAVPTFTTKVSTTKPRQFVKDVYQYSLSRLPDETGFAYWEDQIQNKKTSPEDFVRNLLSEKEFLNAHKTTAQKIEGLYKVIVNRASDVTGLNFWTEKYNEVIAKGYSESMALSIIVDQMVNEQEFKTRVNGLGL